MIAIGTNASALMAQAATASVQIDAETAMQRLSSGKRINAAKDDAAGVAIASRMTSHVKGLHQSIRNSMDAQALISTAEGGLQETEVLLQRIRELAVQASNDTNSEADRTNLNNEAQQLLAGIDAIASGTTWAGQNLLDGTYSNKSFQVGGGSMAADQVITSLQSSTAIELGLGATSSTSVVTTTTQEPTTTYSTNDVDTPIKVGNETQANQTTIGNQEYSATRRRPNNDAHYITGGKKTANLNDGRWINLWENVSQDGTTSEIIARVFAADGTPSGGEFRIDQGLHTLNVQPAVTSLSDGGFAVAWRVTSADGNTDSIKMRIFHQDGQPETDEFLLSDSNPASNRSNLTAVYDSPDIIELANGNIVVGYDGLIDYGHGWGIAAVITSSTGEIVRSQFSMHVYTNNYQLTPRLTALDDGSLTAGFAVVYESAHVGGNQAMAKIFTNNGVASKTEIRLNTVNGSMSQDLAANDQGGFLAVWQQGNEIQARMVDSSLTPLGAAEFQVNTTTSGRQSEPSIVTLADGGFVIAWKSNGQDNSGSGIYGQRFSADLDAVGNEFQINTYEVGNQIDPKLSSSDGKTFLASWTSNSQDGDGNGIYQQIFSTQETTSTTTYETVTTTETVTSTVAGIDLTSGELSREALTRLDTALETINSQRAELGSLSNRLDHIIANNTNASTNAKASLGRIQDADFAAETTKLAKSKILEQSSTAMLAQANASVYEVLTLIPD